MSRMLLYDISFMEICSVFCFSPLEKRHLSKWCLDSRLGRENYNFIWETTVLELGVGS